MVYVQLKTRKKGQKCIPTASSKHPLMPWSTQLSPASLLTASKGYSEQLFSSECTLSVCKLHKGSFIYNTLLHLKASAHAEYPGYSIRTLASLHLKKTQINAPPPPTHLAENIGVDLRTTSRDAFNSCKMQMRSGAKIPARIKQNRDAEVLWKTFLCVSWNNLYLDCASQGIHSMKGEELIKSSLLMLCSL